jgi:hypothetical protein
MGVGGQHHIPATLPPPEKDQYPLHRRVGGPQGQSGHTLKTSPTPGFDPWTIQPIACHYTTTLSQLPKDSKCNLQIVKNPYNYQQINDLFLITTYLE